MKNVDSLHFARREEWRAWLGKNHSTNEAIWMIFYKGHTGVPTITYEDAVEEALCFGKIASNIYP